jgi:hypothetical protein
MIQAASAQHVNVSVDLFADPRHRHPPTCLTPTVRQ